MAVRPDQKSQGWMFEIILDKKSSLMSMMAAKVDPMQKKRILPTF
jgi:hypothetical protein